MSLLLWYLLPFLVPKGTNLKGFRTISLIAIIVGVAITLWSIGYDRNFGPLRYGATYLGLFIMIYGIISYIIFRKNMR